MAINTPQAVLAKESDLARENGNADPLLSQIEIRPLSIAELMRVAGGPTIDNNNQR